MKRFPKGSNHEISMIGALAFDVVPAFVLIEVDNVLRVQFELEVHLREVLRYCALPMMMSIHVSINENNVFSKKCNTDCKTIYKFLPKQYQERPTLNDPNPSVSAMSISKTAITVNNISFIATPFSMACVVVLAKNSEIGFKICCPLLGTISMVRAGLLT